MRHIVALCLVAVLVGGCVEVQPYQVRPAEPAAVGPVSNPDLVLAALLIGATLRHRHVRRQQQARNYQAAPVVLAGHPGRRQHNPHQAGRRHHRHH